MGLDLASAGGGIFPQNGEIFFLLIEDKDYSKSRTKIGLSVDISVKKQKALEPKTQ